MTRKSTGVYVLDKYNQPYELSEYQLFVREECAKLKQAGISIPGRGNTIKYVAKLWQEKKAGKINSYIMKVEKIKTIEIETDNQILYKIIQESNKILLKFNNKNNNFKGIQV